MFQKSANAFSLPVVMTLTNGERLRGDLVLPRTMSLSDALNRDEKFTSFVSSDGREMVIAKQSIATAAEHDLPARDQLDQRGRPDPHQLLGVAPEATHDQIREAYLRKVRLYHPDQFVSVTLPAEVLEYMQATFQHVHEAYEELARRGRSAEGKAA